MPSHNTLYVRFAVVALACFIAGYATLSLSATSETDAPGKSSTVAQDKANIYLYRDPNIKVAVTTKLSVNGKEVEATKRNTCGHWEVNPGTYDISSASARCFYRPYSCGSWQVLLRLARGQGQPHGLSYKRVACRRR